MKKSIKKTICIFLSALMLIAALPATTFASEKSGDFFYYLNPDGTAMFLRYDSEISGNFTIPEKIDGHTVTAIGTQAFMGCTELTSITIPDSVTLIEWMAFYDCSSLTNITIPDSVTNIEHDAFNNSGYYKNASNWSDGVLYIGNHLIECKDEFAGAYQIKAGTKSIADDAFYGCTSLISITVPASVTSIGGNAFYNCTLLTNITIPDSVTEIGYWAFYGCTSLTSITIGDGVKYIGSDAFNKTGYYNNADNWSGGVLYIGNHLLKCKEDFSGDYEIKPGTKYLSGGAFSGCDSLESIIIPDGVTAIGGSAFSNCPSLKSITIPYGVTSIPDFAFSGCDSLESIKIPDGVTSIGLEAFNGCTSLKNITIPYGVTSIGVTAFMDCTSLTSITIPGSVTYIGDYAFRNCTSLTRIFIPDSVTKIEYGALYGCTNLSDVYYSGTEEQWNNIYVDDINIDIPSATIHFNSSQHEHTWNAWTETKPAACTVKGIETRTCEVCGEAETRDIEALGHAYGEWTEVIAATDDAPGLKKRVCSVCGDEETRATDLHSLIGDVNGDGKIKANDARIILRVAAGLDSLADEKIKLADINGDGKIKANDARIVLRIAAGLE